MSTFIPFTIGSSITALLASLPPETLINIFGCLLGLLCAVCAIYLYVLATQTTPQPVRRSQRRPVRRAQRYPASWPLAGQMALQGGAA